MQTRILSQSIAISRHTEVCVFLLVLIAAVMCLPRNSSGEGCGGKPAPGVPSAYTLKAPPFSTGSYITEDPTWARFAARGKAFAGCPDYSPLLRREYEKPPLKKHVPRKKKAASTSSRGLAESSKAPPKARNTASPCPPILMPVPALPVCPDPAK